MAACSSCEQLNCWKIQWFAEMWMRYKHKCHLWVPWCRSASPWLHISGPDPFPNPLRLTGIGSNAHCPCIIVIVLTSHSAFYLTFFLLPPKINSYCFLQNCMPLALTLLSPTLQMQSHRNSWQMTPGWRLWCVPQPALSQCPHPLLTCCKDFFTKGKGSPWAA